MSEFHAILEPIADLLERKNHDYGDSYTKLRDEYGPAAFLIRLADKMERVKQLMTSSASLVRDESIEDTLQDIIGYTALELRYRLRERKTEADKC